MLYKYTRAFGDREVGICKHFFIGTPINIGYRFIYMNTHVNNVHEKHSNIRSES